MVRINFSRLTFLLFMWTSVGLAPLNANSDTVLIHLQNSRKFVINNDKTNSIQISESIKVVTSFYRSNGFEQKVPSISMKLTGRPFGEIKPGEDTHSVDVIKSIKLSLGKETRTYDHIDESVRICDAALCRKLIEQGDVSAAVSKNKRVVALAFLGSDGGNSYIACVIAAKGKIKPVLFEWLDNQKPFSVAKKCLKKWTHQ